VVACDESAWKTIELKSGFDKSLNETIMGLTDLDRHITYGRGWMIIHPLDITADAQPQHIIAHEMGHVLANTHNEDKAERKGQELLSEGQLAKGGN
jgi:hypothetical protein